MKTEKQEILNTLQSVIKMFETYDGAETFNELFAQACQQYAESKRGVIA